jgi:hypothetical protein
MGLPMEKVVVTEATEAATVTDTVEVPAAEAVKKQSWWSKMTGVAA